MKPVDAMTLDEVRAELKAYKPATFHEVVTSLEFIERRAALWGRFDALMRARTR